MSNLYSNAFLRPPAFGKLPWRIVGIAAALALLALLVWQSITAAGVPDPTLAKPSSLAGVLDIGVLVFREGLECILVLSAITAGMVKTAEKTRRAVGAGVGVGFLATLATWFVAVGVINDLTRSFKALSSRLPPGCSPLLFCWL